LLLAHATGGLGQRARTRKRRQKNIGAGRIENHEMVFNEIAVATIFSEGAIKTQKERRRIIPRQD
jgi:hypothetical protein